MKPKIWLTVLLILIAGFFGIRKVLQFFEIDACLDHGGSWNYENSYCDTIDEKPITDWKPIESAKAEKTDNLLKVELQKLLTEAYQKNSLDSLTLFLDRWKAASENIQPSVNDSVTLELYQIFNEVYHPFELENYGWSPREHYKQYKYAIPQTNLIYQVGNRQIDTLTNFSPKKKFRNASVLNSDQAFEDALSTFLLNEGHEGVEFIWGTLLMPVTNEITDFHTSPEVSKIQLNEELNSAKVTIRLIDTGLELNLEKVKDKWQVIEVEELWIE